MLKLCSHWSSDSSGEVDFSAGLSQCADMALMLNAAPSQGQVEHGTGRKFLAFLCPQFFTTREWLYLSQFWWFHITFSYHTIYVCIKIGFVCKCFVSLICFSVEFHEEYATLRLFAEEPVVEWAGHHHTLGREEHPRWGLGRGFYSPETGRSKI